VQEQAAEYGGLELGGGIGHGGIPCGVARC
jgi:hypothetical protein